MKKILYILYIFVFVLACEDVIQVDVPNGETRLVIDAQLRWIKGTDGSKQVVQLSLTTPYFEEEISPASGATVVVYDSTKTAYEFTEDEASGIYINENFNPQLNENYTISITYNNEEYSGTELLVPVVPFDFVTQREGVGFAGDETEIRAFYSDPEDEKNWYLFEFYNPLTTIRTNEVYNDEFSNGNQVFGFYFDDDLKTGDTLIIANQGISERFHDYMDLLLQQTDEENGDPFETQPATVRGNCVNMTNPDNFPLGYFRASEVSAIPYIVQ